MHALLSQPLALVNHPPLLCVSVQLFQCKIHRERQMTSCLTLLAVGVFLALLVAPTQAALDRKLLKDIIEAQIAGEQSGPRRQPFSPGHPGGRALFLIVGARFACRRQSNIVHSRPQGESSQEVRAAGAEWSGARQQDLPV